MKTRLLWIAILAVGIPAFYFGITQPHVSSIPSSIREPISDLRPASPPPLEPPAFILPAMPIVVPPLPKAMAMPMLPMPRVDAGFSRPEVPIQNGPTIDISTGTPLPKSLGKDQDALDLALKEIAEAIKGDPPDGKK